MENFIEEVLFEVFLEELVVSGQLYSKYMHRVGQPCIFRELTLVLNGTDDGRR